MKKKGIHLYINIKNLNELVIKDSADNELNHVIHQMNTLFTSIEDFVSKNYNDSVTIEKVTGSRLHLIISGESATEILIIICKFSYMLSKEFKNFSKYANLDILKLQFGADEGYYVEEEIKLIDGDEYTSIGYPANYAAKLQSIAREGALNISERLYKLLECDEQRQFIKLNDELSKEIMGKYNNGPVYYFQVKNFENPYIFTKRSISNMKDFIEAAKNKSNQLNYSSMETIEPKSSFSFDNWSIKKTAKFQGTIVFADVRGFTKQFKSDGSNLIELVIKTIEILQLMYKKSVENKGIHIQFQGDREMVLFPNELYDDACVFAIKLIDSIKKMNKHIGVGISHGNLFGFKIGIRGEKDNVMLGIPVICADKLEDLYSEEDCISISEHVYKKLNDKYLKQLFVEKGKVEKLNCKYYSTDLGFTYYVEQKKKIYNNKKPDMKYTKPYWSNEIHG